MLHIVPTPIGNLKDITLRALEVLQGVDGVICEDTRRTSLLLNHYKDLFRSRSEDSIALAHRTLPFADAKRQIKKPLLVLNDYNESTMVPQIIERLKNGQNLALVSDAGTPLISDPGYKLVRECLNQGIQVDSLPGPSSVITALTLSGLPPDKFLFLGYPPEKAGHRKDLLGKMKILNEKLPQTFIMFVSPYKLLGILHDLQDTFGDIEVVLAHELTKIHQSVERKTISKWLQELKNPKGEYILLFNNP